jgi:hypothetical protein
MNIYALIDSGMVVNTIVADPSFLPEIEQDYDAIVRIDDNPQHPGIGWSYADGTFTPPPDPPPAEE